MEKNIDRLHVQNLLKHYGRDSLSYFHLQDDRLYFFSPNKKSFLSYRIYNSVALVSGDPVGTPADCSKLLQSFIAYAKTWNLHVCIISISEDFRKQLEALGYAVRRIGEEAVVTLDTFDRKNLKKKVRRAVKHIERMQIDILFYRPSTLPAFLKIQLAAISQEWLQNKGKREKGYSMTLKRLPTVQENDCLIALAIQNNKVIGFATFMPIYQQSGFSLDLIRKVNDAPNGLNEFLIIKTLEYLKAHHIQVVTLNFATFIFSFPSVNKVKSMTSKLLGMLFKCNTLYSFNTKFNPVWKSRYISFIGHKSLPLSLVAIMRAER